MATRQYIGARYVIKIYENSQSAGSAEWEASTSYEPLTMVTYQNSSYLSKKAVPATVGNPPSNSDYWVVTGAYNGQIAQLQDDVAAINTNIGNMSNLNTSATTLVDAINEVLADINSITDKYYLLVTDSYGDPVGCGTNNTWEVYFKQYMGLTEGVNCLTTYQDSAGFNPVYANPHKFVDVITPGTETHGVPAGFDTSLITDIVVVGGANERGQTLANVELGIAQFMAYVEANYTNCKNVYICGCGNSFNILTAASMDERAFLSAYKVCMKYGAKYLAGTENILQNYDYYNKESDPNNTYVEGNQLIHPNEEGGKMIAIGVKSAIESGAFCVDYPYIIGTFTKNTAFASQPTTAKINLAQRLIGSKVMISWANMTFATGSPISVGNNQWITLGSFTNDIGYLKPNNFPNEIDVLAFVAGGDFGAVNTPLPSKLRFKDNEIQLQIDCGDAKNTNFIGIRGGGGALELMS